jgi:hypothetical protein
VFVVGLDLLRYLNSGQMTKIRAVMQEEREAASGWEPPVQRHTPQSRLKAELRRRRIRVHLVSGIEFEMFVFIVAPLTGWIFGVTVVTGALLVLFEVRLILLLWKATRQHAKWKATQPPLADVPAQGVDPDLPAQSTDPDRVAVSETPGMRRAAG